MSDIPEKLLTIHQVAAMFQVHITTVRRWRKAGKLAGVMRGKRLRFPESEVLALLTKRES